MQAARGIAEAHLELRRLQEFKLTLIDVDATSLRTDRKAAGDDGHPGDDDKLTMQYNVRAYVRTLPLLATLERYERRAQSRHRRAFQTFAIANEE